MSFPWKARSKEMYLCELLKENAPVLNAELRLFEDALGGVLAPVLPDAPDFSFPEKGAPEPEEVLLNRLSNAISGMLAGEQAALDGAQNHTRALTQADYIQLPLLTLEAFRHGVGMAEIVEGWNSWIADDSAPEKLLYAAWKDGCPMEKLGAYQAFSSNAMQIVQRAVCWALPYAYQPEKAARFAYFDAYTSTRGALLNTAMLFSAVIAYAFMMPPQDAVRAAMYGMPFDFMDRCNPNTGVRPAASDASPEEQCRLFLYAMQTSHSADDCFMRLSTYGAAPCCYMVAGAVYGAASKEIPDADSDRIPTKLAFSQSVSRQELARRLTQCNPCLQNKNAPWDTNDPGK